MDDMFENKNSAERGQFRARSFGKAKEDEPVSL